MEERDVMRVEELKRRVRQGGYAVDSAAVAQAMLRRPALRRLLLDEAGRRPGSATERADGGLEPN